MRISQRQESRTMFQSNLWVLILKPAVIVYFGLLCLYILAVWISLKPANKTVTNTCRCVPGCFCCKPGGSLLCSDDKSELMSVSLTWGLPLPRWLLGMKKESLCIAVLQVSCKEQGLSSPALKLSIIYLSFSCQAAFVPEEEKSKSCSLFSFDFLFSFSLFSTWNEKNFNLLLL